MSIKVGQKYRILDPVGFEYQTELCKDDIITVDWIDKDGDGWCEGEFVILKTDISDGHVELIITESPLVNAVFDDIISNHIKNPHIAEAIVDTFNYELREEFVKRVFDLEEV